VRRPVYSGQFRKDIKLVQKRGKDMEKFKAIARRLAEGETLPAKYRDHPLVGNWARHRECHIEPDWLLIYRIEGEDLIFERTGTHADLFR
jgi:mRNA interferase YafQ